MTKVFLDDLNGSSPSNRIPDLIVSAFQRALRRDEDTFLNCSFKAFNNAALDMPEHLPIPKTLSNEELGRLAAKVLQSLDTGAYGFNFAASRAIITNLHSESLDGLGEMIRDFDRPACYNTAAEYLEAVLETAKMKALNSAYPQ